MKKRISIDLLRPGMYITGLDQSWFKTPFLRHKWLIKREDEIHLLQGYGIQEIIIDTTKGIDILDQETSSTEQHAGDGSGDATAEDSASSKDHPHDPDPQEIQTVRSLRAEAIYALDTIFQNIDSELGPHLREIRHVVSTLLDGLLEHQTAMVSLIQMRRFDQNLSTHVVDTCVLSLAIAKEKGFDTVHLKALGLGALLHDIGQLRLPLNLLRKRVRYSPHDHKLMQAHPEMGVAMIDQFPDIPEDTRRTILEHHERLDGAGYPKGLRGQEISPLSQILSISDTYDAQISGRCSLPPVPPAQALRELYRSGLDGQYELSIIQQLIQFLGVYPIGSLVELTSGEQAVVVWVHPHARLQPSIKLISDPAGKPYEEQEIVDLSMPGKRTTKRTITRALDPNQENIDIAQILESLW